MNETPKPKRGWRILRRILITLAVLTTLVAAFYAEEDWRGKHDWENYQRAAEARGERFTWAEFFTNTIPDDQNFAKAPIFSSLTTAEWDEQKLEWKSSATNEVDRLQMSIWRSDGSWPDGAIGAWDQARLTRLDKWQDYYRNSATNHLEEFPVAPQAQSPAADVLLALSKYDPSIEELRVASRRPFSRFGGYSASNVKDFTMMFKYLTGLKGCSQVLQLRAIAELASNQSAKALDDVQLLLRLHDELRQEPLFIEHLVGLAITALTLQPIYEGLAQHRWNDAQLADLASALAAKDFLADYQRAVRGEQVYAIDALENQRITREYKTMETSDKKTTVNTTSLRLLPSAYFYQSELAIARLNEQFIQPLVNVTNRLASPAALRHANAEVKAGLKHHNPYKIQALILFPAIGQAVEKFAWMQSSLNLARVACALERYRLAHDEYPETLDVLAPQFIAKLPHDIINGQPLHYRREADGRFVLYSVGWNETDDGGQVVLTKSGSVDQEKGDWVWQYPAK